MSAIPNLAGVATADLVEKIGGGNFSAAYINWSRTLHLLRENAPGWLPELVPSSDGGVVHVAPVGAFLLIRFRNMETGAVTPSVPQAIMDSRNASIPVERVTARDITDTHRRGACMAAALTFGLAYELWAKLPLESGYAEPEPEEKKPVKPAAVAGRPLDGAWDGFNEEAAAYLREVGAECVRLYSAGQVGAACVKYETGHDSDEKVALWTLFDSKMRAAMKKHKAENKD
jgi:hypothetical protein